MADYEIYKIQKGDNLTKIAKQYNTTVDELVKLNNIENPDLIYAGADLKIPLSQAATQEKAKAAAELAKKRLANEEAKKKAAAAEKEKTSSKKGFLSDLIEDVGDAFKKDDK